MYKQIITLSGKAEQVFKYLALLARTNPTLTLGEIANEYKM
jgi:hypothetical protein